MNRLTEIYRRKPLRLACVILGLAMWTGCAGWLRGTFDPSHVRPCTNCLCTSWWDANDDGLCDNGEVGVSYGERCGHTLADHPAYREH